MSSAEEALKVDRQGQRVLSIQSHVVSGYAGNKCSIFPLQLHGFEVDFINSVQFSNHTGYENGVKGQRLTDNDLQQLYEGLKANSLNKYSYLLTGYCGNPTFLRKIVEIAQDLKKINPQLVFVCDPVLGDDGKYYTPKELMPIYANEVLKVADIITPNVFELSEITGTPITNEADCLRAVRSLHLTSNIRVIVVTSGIFAEGRTDLMYCYASHWSPTCAGTWNETECSVLRFEIPVVHGRFTGTGDVFTSLLVVWLNHFQGDLRSAICNVISSMQSLLKRTSSSAYGNNSTETNPNAAQRELKLVESRYDILVPKGTIACSRIA